MLMKLNHNGEVITLNENEQAEIYEFYRLHSTMERLVDVLLENGSPMRFSSNEDLEIVAKRVLLLEDDYHLSEDEAIETVFDDENFINKYITYISEDISDRNSL